MAGINAAPNRSVARQELISDIFESRSEPAARSYLRQTLYRLREVLPVDLAPSPDGERLTLPGRELVTSSAEEVLAAIGLADRQPAETPIRTLTAALARTEGGPFTHHTSSPWQESPEEGRVGQERD